MQDLLRFSQPFVQLRLCLAHIEAHRNRERPSVLGSTTCGECSIHLRRSRIPTIPSLRNSAPRSKLLRRRLSHVARYARSGRRSRPTLRAATGALSRFPRPALIVWASEDRMMPLEHAHGMAALLSDSDLIEISDAYTLLTIDQPAMVAADLRAFLAREPP